MDRTVRRARSVVAMAVVLVATSGCASLGGVLGGVGLPGMGDRVLDGEVRGVDMRRDRLSIRGYDGRTRTVRVHRDTRVRYERRTYPVSALERGDEVRVYVTVDRRGTGWADRVDVRRSVQERNRGGRYGARVERLDGYLTRMNLRDRWLAVEPRRGGREVVVYLPSRLDRGDARRIERLRRGERVRLDVVPLARGEAELVRVR